MKNKADHMRQNSPHPLEQGGGEAQRFCRLIGHVLEQAPRDIPRPDFVEEILRAVAREAPCDLAELRLVERKMLLRWRLDRRTAQVLHEVIACRTGDTDQPLLGLLGDGGLCPLLDDLSYADSRIDLPAVFNRGPSRTGERGGVSIDDVQEVLAGSGGTIPEIVTQSGGAGSLLALPFDRGGGRRGVLLLVAAERAHFSPECMPFLEELARVIGVAMAHREARRDLRERVKELSCLYGMARIAAERDLTLGEVLARCVELLPPAWLYPDQAAARIEFDGRSFATVGFPEDGQRLVEAIAIGGRRRGQVEVRYRAKMHERDDGPFLAEERRLLAKVAQELGMLIEQRTAEEELHGLRDQLRHADRLATIGQVAAGVVHELNEPLGSILGFAQLVKKETGLPVQARQDVDKIVGAALHSREVVRRLMLFARRTPPVEKRANLNEIIAEGLYFLEARCERVGIELVRDLERDLPEIAGDPSQLYQVLVNLVVNAIQAIPAGGRITIRTRSTASSISMIVEDTGVGMSQAVRERALQPFFTTKDVNEGTGLGLAVVSGIVEAHGGTIHIESEEGRGSRFEIRLPRGAQTGQTGEVVAHG